MKVLVIGGGGREHALAWKLSQSPKTHKIYVAPGNGGSAKDPRFENVNITDVTALCAWAVAEKVALTVVGPEVPLAAGVVDDSANTACAFLDQPRPPRSWKAPRRFPRRS